MMQPRIAGGTCPDGSSSSSASIVSASRCSDSQSRAAVSAHFRQTGAPVSSAVVVAGFSQDRRRGHRPRRAEVPHRDQPPVAQGADPDPRAPPRPTPLRPRRRAREQRRRRGEEDEAGDRDGAADHRQAEGPARQAGRAAARDRPRDRDRPRGARAGEAHQERGEPPQQEGPRTLQDRGHPPDELMTTLPLRRGRPEFRAGDTARRRGRRRVAAGGRGTRERARPGNAWVSAVTSPGTARRACPPRTAGRAGSRAQRADLDPSPRVRGLLPKPASVLVSADSPGREDECSCLSADGVSPPAAGAVGS